MEGKEHPKEFPDVTQKLSAPKKLSAFEKERQAAQAKQARAEAENAAALKAFENSFAAGDEDDEDDSFSHLSSSRGPPTGPRGPGMGFGGAGSRYGMPPGGPRSGPGSLGPLPGPPPPSLKRKRALDEMREAQEARREHEEMLSYEEDSRNDSRGAYKSAGRDDEQDVDSPRPTVQLSSLPPNISPNEIKALLSDHVQVQSVRFLHVPPAGPTFNMKRSLSAIVTLASDMSNSQIDAVVSALKDKYLGCGFYLSISRHLSSSTFHPSMAATTSTTSAEPFGAEKSRDSQPRFSMRNAPPPDSYDSPMRSGHGAPNQPDAIVPVRPPPDIESIKAIHTIVDQLLLEPDPQRAVQMEAMLMSLPVVQKDERFAFLYDSRSPAGIYYRFLLWAPDDPDDAAKELKRRDLGIERIHDDVPISWHPPYSHVPFPDLKSLEQVVTDIDYVSSDEESDDDGGERQFNAGREGEGGGEINGRQHLTPLQRARLVHLLSRLPTSNARLRKGDVARVTNFAINHAGPGAEEIVDILLLNLEKPFSYSLASKYEEQEQEQDEEDVYEPDDDLSTLNSPAPQSLKDSKREDDPSNAKLIALYLISDVLSASSTAGARNAWKYRQLFESGFKAQKTFEHLGKLDKDLAWGRLKAEQWKRKVGVVFGIWEGWSVFNNEVHDELKTSFFDPPLSDEEKAAAQAEAEREEKKKQEEKWMGKFKRVGSAASPVAPASPAPAPAPREEMQVEEDIDGAPLDDVDGAPLEDEVDGMPMEDDVDGMPMVENNPSATLGGLDGASDERPSTAQNGKPSAKPIGKSSGPRRRMRAEDMFADSDEE